MLKQVKLTKKIFLFKKRFTFSRFTDNQIHRRNFVFFEDLTFIILGLVMAFHPLPGHDVQFCFRLSNILFWPLSRYEFQYFERKTTKYLIAPCRLLGVESSTSEALFIFFTLLETKTSVNISIDNYNI